jgi:D-alanyl-D-alanine carboxypeptidase
MRQSIRALWAMGLVGTLVHGGCSSAASPPPSSASSTTTTVGSPDTTRTLPSSTAVEPSTTTSTIPPPATGVAPVAAYVTDLIHTDRFSGVVLIADGDQVVFEAAGGLADREAEVANSMDTRFNLGSMNKMFTAVAVLQLMEAGLLTLESTVAEYLPDYPNREVAEQVNVEQLLTHTSGLGDVFTEEFNADPHSYRATEDYLPLFADEPLQFTPGERFAYSNAGYVVLGLIIERLSGLSYADYVAAEVFEPAGMLSTGMLDVEEAAANLAVGYTTQDIWGNETGVLQANTSMMPGRGFAAGGGYATAGDLLRFRNALVAHRLLSSASVDLLLTGRVEVRERIWYAFGFFDRVQSGQRVVGHTGGAPGVCAFLDMYPESGYTVVVLSNADHDCSSVMEYLADHPLL